MFRIPSILAGLRAGQATPPYGDFGHVVSGIASFEDAGSWGWSRVGSHLGFVCRVERTSATSELAKVIHQEQKEYEPTLNQLLTFREPALGELLEILDGMVPIDHPTVEARQLGVPNEASIMSE